MSRSSRKTYAFIGTISYRSDTGSLFSVSNALIHTSSSIGSPVPGYREKIAHMADASSGYSFQGFDGEVSTPPSSSSCEFTLAGKRILGTGLTFGSSNFSVPVAFVDSSAQDLALRHMKQKLSEESGQFQTLIPMGQINETRRLIRDTAKSTEHLIRALYAIKHGRGSPRRVAKAASNAWLNFSFGINPTLSDLDGLCTSIRKTLSSTDRVVHVSGHNSVSSSNVLPYYAMAACPGGQFNISQVEHHTTSYKYNGAFRVPEILSANNYATNLADQFGISPRGLPTLAWELTPYSWVIDYFTNVGEFLEDTFIAPSGTMIYLDLSAREKVKITSRGNFVYTSGNGSGSGTYNPYSAEFVRLTRTPLAVLPHVGLRFRSVDRIGKNAVNKLLNLSSILLK